MLKLDYLAENLIKNNGFNLEDTLIFESKFESGNLQLAYLTDSENYDKYQLFLHNDTNTLGYTQWFFYRVTKNQKNIKNCKKKLSCKRSKRVFMVKKTKEEALETRNNVLKAALKLFYEKIQDRPLEG